MSDRLTRILSLRRYISLLRAEASNRSSVSTVVSDTEHMKAQETISEKLFEAEKELMELELRRRTAR